MEPEPQTVIFRAAPGRRATVIGERALLAARPWNSVSPLVSAGLCGARHAALLRPVSVRTRGCCLLFARLAPSAASDRAREQRPQLIGEQPRNRDVDVQIPERDAVAPRLNGDPPDPARRHASDLANTLSRETHANAAAKR